MTAASSASPPRSPHRFIGPLALGYGVPAAFALLLWLLRPDLMAPMFDGPYGLVLGLGVVVFSTAAAALYLIASLARIESRAARISLRVVGFVLFTLPVCFALLFAPIVHAFVYGNVAR